MARWTLVCVAVLVAAAALAPSAGAVIVPGPNGPLVFTSGRTLSDPAAQIWFLSGPGGSATRLTTLSLSHHRHAAWSPDRTKIAYARGPVDNNPFDGPWNIYVQDLTNPGSAPVPITSSPLNEDRPSWSPDGTRLAYAKQVAATTWNVVTKSATGTGGETTVAVDAATGAGASGQFSRPQWSPNGQQIFYGRAVGVGTYDIYRSPANGSNVVGTGIITGPTNDYQPSLSADGTKLCFTREDANGKDVNVAPSTGGAATPLLTTVGIVEYECAWSPNGARIAFVRGAFGAGQILVRDSNATGIVSEVTDVTGVFDGNPEWTYNPSPECVDGAASVAFNSFVQITLTCKDARDPLSYDVHGVFEEIVTPPANGNLGALEDEMVIYTPNADFRGDDSFTFKANDGTSDSAPARIDITVGGPGGGGGPPGAANVTALSVSPKRFRRGRLLPTASQTPVGTTIGVTLSARGRVKLSFRRARPGRRVRGRCVRPTPQNRNRRRCKRYVKAGTLSFDGKRGANTVRFQGRLSRRKTLPLGRYRLAATVTADGRTSPARAVSFRIVRR